jgi:hypothetical protein
MTERGLPSAEGSPACPFVAFEDDRDQRADRPDHRHRCFADTEPAPRALAHQEAYCLSSAFPVCPVFQEWARREAARATHVAGMAADPADGDAGPGGSMPHDTDDALASSRDEADAPDDADGVEDAWGVPSDDTPIEEGPRRNPPRDWAAPPPWAGGAGGQGRAGGAGARGGEPDIAAEFLAPRSGEGMGLAGSAADRLAGGDSGRPVSSRSGTGPPLPPIPDSPAAPADPELAGLVGVGRTVSARSGPSRPTTSHVDLDPSERPPTRRPAVSSTRDRDRQRERDREVAERSRAHDGPSWERQRRFEAYPTIKTRAGLSGVALPRAVILFGALVVAAIALFFLPALLGVGGRDPAATARPSTSAPVATASPSATPIPEPTAQTYTIKAGDTLSKIARDNGLTLEQLRDANPEITNPNLIAVGDVIIIPVPPPDEVDGGEASPSP